jgi:hypothetical protein
MYMFNWIKINIILYILGEFDGFPRFPTSYSLCITTPTKKREYKRDPWMEEIHDERDASLCLKFPNSCAIPCFPIFMRLSSPMKTLVFQYFYPLYLINKKPIDSLDPREHKNLEVYFIISCLG